MSDTHDYSVHVAHAMSIVAQEAGVVGAYARDTHEAKTRPSAIWQPRIYIDGNQWCALYGEDLQSGVAGFGESPAAAMNDFDRNWFKPLKEARHG